LAGATKPAEISAFLDAHAAPAAAAAGGGGGGGAGDGSSLSEEVTADNVADKVGGSDPWLLLFGDAAKGAEAVAEAVYGQVKVGVADASLAATYGVKGGSGVAMLKYGTSEKAAKNAKAFGSSEEAVGDAKKAALESIPDDYVEKLSQQTVDMWMQGVIGPQGTFERSAMCLLFSEKAEVPPMFRSLGMRFEGKLGFAMLPAALGARFNVQKTPAVLLMFPVPPDQVPEAERPPDGQRSDRTHGPIASRDTSHMAGTSHASQRSAPS